MEDKEKTKFKNNLKIHPKERSNFLSHFFFCWELPIFLKGWKKELTEDDMYAPIKKYSSKKLGDKLERFWMEEEQFQKQPSLKRALRKLIGFEFFMCAAMFLPIDVILSLVQILFLNKLLNFYTFQQPEKLRNQAYVDAAVLSTIFIIRVILFNWFMFRQAVIGMKTRIACSSLIYRRSLTMKSSQKFTIGHIVNLLSNDARRFEMVFGSIHVLWIGPLYLLVGAAYVDSSLGHIALVGITVMILCAVLQLSLGKVFSKCRSKIAEATDTRIRLLSNVITGIKTIKMYVWEKPFSNLISAARKTELKYITTSTNFRLMISTFHVYITRLSLFFAVIAAILFGFPLSSEYVFTLACLFETLKTIVIIYFPVGVIYFAEALTSVRRIEEFLLDSNKESKKSNSISKNFDNIISVNKVSVKWDLSSPEFILKNINFEARLGELIVITGTSGSGKSTFLHTVLQEINIVEGNVQLGGTISYSSQDPWIFPASIKQNILFKEKFDLEKYNKILDVCGLKHDLACWPHGDQTLVGENGVMLSGGQKARINLARAVYRDADLYVLDDPLSAVDSLLAYHIFNECFCKYLKKKCVLLVTHQLQYLQNIEKVYTIENRQLVQNNNIKKIEKEQNNGTKTETIITSVQKFDFQDEIKEHRSSGNNDKRVYESYCLAAGSSSLTFMILFLFFLAQVFGQLMDNFITFWVNLERNHYIFDISSSSYSVTKDTCISAYIGLMLLVFVCNHIASFSFCLYCMKASKTLYNKMMTGVLNASMFFFNHHDSGRILNRFSRDIGTIDDTLPTVLMNVINSFLTVVGIIITIISLNYWMSVATLIIFTIISLYSILFQPTNRNTKRTEGITRSSIFTHLSASLQGLTTIRTCKAENILKEEFDNCQDTHTSAFYNFTAMFAAFGFWTDITCALYSGLVTFSFFLLDNDTAAGNVGLAITQSINLMGLVQYGIKALGDLHGQMTSVERVLEYSSLTSELDTGKLIPAPSWPQNGQIIFDSVNLQYLNTKPVLKNISFTINPGEKIGIVGRTGAGKTSLISTLFRLFPFEGTIKIDGINTKLIPLSHLRSTLSIIPQDPILFLGSLRQNLDPFDELNDFQLWKVLSEVSLEETVSSLPAKLDTLITEKGTNFSVGQRQLLNLARAILRKARIVILDEATANLDSETDKLIQTTIRRKFDGCTVLTIAHRLNSIIDSDKIVVIENGEIVEFGCPEKLLQNENGIFYNYARQHGTDIEKKLN